MVKAATALKQKYSHTQEKLNSERKADAAETKPTEALPPKTKPPEALPPKTKPPEALPSEAKPPVLPSGAKKNSSQSTSGIPQVAKVGKSLFDDDDDECDLFSSLLKNKPPPMEVAVVFRCLIELSSKWQSLTIY